LFFFPGILYFKDYIVALIATIVFYFICGVFAGHFYRKSSKVTTVLFILFVLAVTLFSLVKGGIIVEPAGNIPVQGI
jgi:predicted PurR-regulated permease PerM